MHRRERRLDGRAPGRGVECPRPAQQRVLGPGHPGVRPAGEAGQRGTVGCGEPGDSVRAQHPAGAGKVGQLGPVGFGETGRRARDQHVLPGQQLAGAGQAGQRALPVGSRRVRPGPRGGAQPQRGLDGLGVRRRGLLTVERAGVHPGTHSGQRRQPVEQP
ncbi:hypothetical protein OHA72_50190 [Dactylosporangium sp. NBC_01737]|nr:hypothetical protein OHA72_50190 [Dactylosporangium sp. NBC_01737]